MAEKAQIIIYDDLMIIDETETFYKDSEQLAGIATSCLRSTPSAEMVEVYVKKKLKMKFTLTNRGKVKKESIHPNWGGARPNSGPKRKGPRIDHVVMFRMDDESYDYISKMDSYARANWLRCAVKEKMTSEKKSKGSQ